MDKVGFLLMLLILFLLLVFSVFYIYLDDLKSLFIGITKKRRVNAKLKKFAVDHDFPLLSDVVIQVRENKYVKLDHVMIGNKYIYVIACKCYYGYLNAKAIDEKWVLYRRDKLIHIENPLKNNYKRMKILSSLLDNSIEDFVNIIYLSKPVVASKIEGSNKKEFVLFEDDFEKFIEVYEKECDLNEFSVKSINEAAKKIFEYHNESIVSFKEINVKKDN